MKSCSVSGCEKRYYAKGYCEMHYARVRKHGDTGSRRAAPGTGWTGRDGYRRLRVSGRHCLEHRLVWERAHGPIPAGFEIHHRNHLRHDNRLENLEILPIGVHRACHRQKQGSQCARLDCHRAPFARGLCNTHYRAWWKRNRASAGIRGSNGDVIKPKELSA